MRAFVSVSIVVNVFDETTNNVSAGSRPASAPAMSAPSTLDTKRAVDLRVAERVERPVGHRRPEVGAADADVDDGADALRRWRPSTARRGPARRTRPCAPSTSWTSGDDVVRRRASIDRRRAGGAQGDVQHGPVLGDVDPLAGEHRVAAPGDAGGVGDGEQGGEDVVVDALLGVVDAQVADGDEVALGRGRVGGEQLAQVGRAAAWRAAPPTAASS